MAEYIERSAIMRRIETETFRWGEEYDLQQILGDIEDAPTVDVVEVVRCKNCKYWDGEGGCECVRNGLILEYTDRLDYCSYGEGKDGAE